MSKYVLITVFCLFSYTWLFAQTEDTHKYLINDTILIPEIIISAKSRIKITGDTVSYAVDSFYTDPLANAGDVLKKLPGVEITQEGKFTIQGKSVIKIFINGKEYNAEDIRTITQNLPAEALEKIQVANWYDEESQFTGIKNGTGQKSINLKLKKEYEQGIYSRVSGGYGTKQRHMGSVFANLMGNDARLTIISNINNTGIADAEAAQNLRQSQMSLPGQIRRKQVNLNYFYDKWKKFKVNGSYELTSGNLLQLQSLSHTTYLPYDSILLRRQLSNQKNDQLLQHLKFRGNYKISEKLNSISELCLTAGNQNINSAIKDTSGYNSYTNPSFARESLINNELTTWSVQGSELLRKKFNKKGRGLSLAISAGWYSNTKSGTTENTSTYYYPYWVNNQGFQTKENNTSIDTRVNIQFTEPISIKSTLLVKYSYAYLDNKYNRSIYNSKGLFDSTQSIFTENTNVENPLGLVYQYQSGKLSAGGGIDVLQYKRKTGYTSGKSGVTQNGTNYFPSLFTRYKLTKYSDLSCNYICSITSPDIKQLQPQPDYTDSLNIFIGNPGLKPELGSNISVNYNLLTPVKQRTLGFYLSVGWINRKIINKTSIVASHFITTPVNMDGMYNMNVAINYTQHLVHRNVLGGIKMESGLINNIIITNGVLQAVRNYNYHPSARLILNSIKWYEGELSYNYNYNKSNILSIMPHSLQAHTIACNGTFFLPYNYRISYSLNYIHNVGTIDSIRKDFLLINGTLDKSFIKPKGLSLRLQGFDVLNNYPNISRNYNDNYYEERTVNRIGNYFILSIIYRFYTS